MWLCLNSGLAPAFILKGNVKSVEFDQFTGKKCRKEGPARIRTGDLLFTRQAH